MSDVQTYRGKQIAILFDGAKCVHSRNCVLGNPHVFIPNAPGPWIQPDAASAEAVMELAHACPSGAIGYERLDGGPAETAPVVNTLRIRENGPLAFHAELAIQGQPAALRATLCRCGLSKNKPFCDGSHHGGDGVPPFVATGEPPTQKFDALPDRSGKLAVTPAPNGPLIVTGAVEICSGTGRTVTQTTKTALCRCGHSSNKPFCDGTHAKIGFKAS